MKRKVQLGAGEAVEYPVATSDAATAVMRGNRKRDTKPELALRRALHARGRRYRVNALIRVGDVKVRPDIVFTAARLAVFVDGCFWHGCSEHGTKPRSNPHYWGPKIARNQARDVRNTDALEGAGWRVLRAWEHEPVEEIVAKVEAELATRGRTAGPPREAR